MIRSRRRPLWPPTLPPRLARWYNQNIRVKPRLRKSRILFVHVPRTGGESISRAIYGDLSVAHIPLTTYRRWFDLSEYSIVAVRRDECDRLLSAQRHVSRTGDRNRLLFMPPDYFVDYGECEIVLDFENLTRDAREKLGVEIGHMGSTADIDGWASHLPTLTRLFARYRIRNVLELGCGLHSTPFFCEHASHVKSVEQSDPAWLEKVRKAVEGNWEGVFAQDADMRGFDLVFIDGKTDLRRPNLAQAIEERCPIIVYHDAEQRMYGYHRVKVPDWYTEYRDSVNGKETAVLILDGTRPDE